MKQKNEVTTAVSTPAVKISSAELARMSQNRQLFALNTLTKSIVFPTNITYWEEMTCVGYNPQFKRLEAVVNVKQPSGYNGNLCSNGSLEYVRFFIDFQDGAGFRDMGYTSFKVADISDAPPGPQHPLSYLATMFIDDEKYRKYLGCTEAVIPKLRAVLSWNSIPSVNPNQTPHYGNRLDVNIQLEPRKRLRGFELAEIDSLKELANFVDPDMEIKLKTEVPTIESIARINKEAGVPPHRTFYSSIGAKLNSTLNFSQAASTLDIADIDQLGIKLTDFLAEINLPDKKANVTFEEVTCVGMHTLTDSVGAVVHIKKNTGFNGNLCSNGSMEHVAFWADWNNNGIFDQYLGTVSFRVHDIQNIPADGLYYNVSLPVNLAEHLKSCGSPNIIRIRAVLSWESLPSTTNPNQLNSWGNSKDALVQLRPKLGSGSGVHAAIYTVGSVDRTMIDPVQHLYNYQAVAPTSSNNRPWGGGISFHGIVERNGDNGTVRYRIEYKNFGASDLTYQPVSLSETFYLDDLNTPAPYFADPQTTIDGWYEYKQKPAVGLYNINNYLATWNASAMPDGTYTIRFRTRDSANTEVVVDTFSIIVCNKGMTISPTANAVVDPAYDMDLVIDGGDCHSYTPGDPVINGHVKVVHPYFASWSLELQPTSHTHGTVPSPSSRGYSALSDNGDGNAVWSLNTSALDPCGYTVSLGAYTRVILNSWSGFPYYAPKAVGFAKLP
jgi:hypothetical protein